jgi:lysophospholipid acyltransferase
MPGLLEFTSYVFFCNAAALGVFFEYSDYKKFIERSHEYVDVPSPILPSLCWLFQGFLWMVIFLVGSKYYYLPECWGDAYVTWPLWYRIFFYHVAMTFKRFFYYGPFSITTGAIIASGFGYNGKGKDQADKWNKVVQIYVFDIECGKSPNELLRYWNHQVHLWLKYYIGGRIVPKDKRPTFAQNMIVFMVSAFWHGFYPFYYVTFVLAMISTEVAKDLFKAKKYLFYSLIPSAFVRHLLANQATLLCLDYFGVTFNALTFENGLKFMSGNCYCVPIALFTILSLCRILGLVPKALKWEQMQAKKQKDQ